MKNYTHITPQERESIFLHLNQGKSYRETGRLLGRSHVAIVKEVKRNSTINSATGDGRGRRQEFFGRKVQKAKRRLTISNRTPIGQRPEEANQRLKFGHWETDLMEGVRSEKDTVSVTVDRKTGFLTLDRLPNKEAASKLNSLIRIFGLLPRLLAKTITFDNGSENYYHEEVARVAGCQTFFCQPYHSWEKATVENTIGLIRSFIPKKSRLSQITHTDLNSIAWELNNRPRKRLGFYTPIEMVYKETGWKLSGLNSV